MKCKKPMGIVFAAGLAGLLSCGPEEKQTIVAHDSPGKYEEEPASGSGIFQPEDTAEGLRRAGIIDSYWPNTTAARGEDFAVAAYAASPLQRSFRDILNDSPYKMRSWNSVQDDTYVQQALEKIQPGFGRFTRLLANGTGVEADYACAQGTGDDAVNRCGGMLVALARENGREYAVFGIAGTAENTMPFLGWKIRENTDTNKDFADGVKGILQQQRRTVLEEP